jgi:predicted alpha-1,2-mannosidase
MSSWSGLPPERTALRALRAAALVLLGACTPPAPDDSGAAAEPVPLSSEDVDVFIATGGPGFRVGSSTPAATAPFGLVKAGPDTSLDGTVYSFYHCSGYYWDDTHIEGFGHFHLVGTGSADYGNVLFMPTDGWDSSKRSPDGWRQPFDHADEVASPGRYAVTLGDGTGVDIVATSHGAHHRYTFPDDTSTPTIVVDVEHVLGGSSLGGEVGVDPADGALFGMSRTNGAFTSDNRVYFYARVEGGFDDFGTWGDDAGERGRTAAAGIDAGLWVSPRSRTPEVRVGISLTSVDAARANLEAELLDRRFDDTAAAAAATWDAALSVVSVAGGSDEQRRITGSALYRALTMPQEHGDVDGRYVGFDGAVHPAEGFTYHSDMSLWDTYRTAHPLYTLLYPARANDFARSLVAMAEQGGAFPRWPAARQDGGSMIGAPADIVLADTWLRGVRDWDAAAAWPLLEAQARGTVEVPYNARPGLDALQTLGWIPSDEQDGSVAWMQETAWADAALARLALALGENEDAAFYEHRAYTWRNVWDPAVGFFHGRRRDGTFEEAPNPVAWESEYVEGNAWQYLWMPFPHHEALAETLGGREAALRRLRVFFEEAEREGVLDFPQTYYWHGNEPDIHAPFLFALWGAPDETLRWVRWVQDTHYAAAPVGLAGNDDGGTLSAWWLFAALGLYPIAGTDEYVVTAPMFEEASFAVLDGVFTVRRVGDGAHVSEVSLDGVPLDRVRIRHQELRPGGSLVVRLE